MMMLRTINFLAIIFLAGCSVFPPTTSPARKQILSALAETVPQRATRPMTLMVLMPQTRPLYDTLQMAYTSKPYQIDFYSQYEWGETPAQMLQPLLVKTLEDTHAFASVLTPSIHAPYTYTLQTEITELIQDYTTVPATLRLSLRLYLNDGASNKTIASKEISLRDPMNDRTPEAGVTAANTATAKALHEIAEFVLDKTR